MMKQPLLSIITITYNCAPTIEATIVSILGQTFEDYEYIIIDGKSSDKTLDIVNKYKNRISKIVSKPDLGIADAFNKGWRTAHGEWVIYINSGDIFCTKDILSELSEHLIKNKSSVVYGNYVVSDSVHRKTVSADHSMLHKFCKPINPICHQSTFVPKKLYELYPFDIRLQTGMDYDVWLRMRANSVPFVKIPMAISEFQVGGISETPKCNSIFNRTLDNIVTQYKNHKSNCFINASRCFANQVDRSLSFRKQLL